MASIALRDTIQKALETEYLGATGWPGLLDKHSDHDPLAVDALIYLLAVALQSPKPTATVALARGCRPPADPNESSPPAKQDSSPRPNPAKSPVRDKLVTPAAAGQRSHRGSGRAARRRTG